MQGFGRSDRRHKGWDAKLCGRAASPQTVSASGRQIVKDGVVLAPQGHRDEWN